MEIARRNVEFKATRSRSTFCICDACHGTAMVMMLTLPETLYHDGKTLTTKHREYWLCERCRAKLLSALKGTR